MGSIGLEGLSNSQPSPSDLNLETDLNNNIFKTVSKTNPITLPEGAHDLVLTESALMLTCMSTLVDMIMDASAATVINQSFYMEFNLYWLETTDAITGDVYRIKVRFYGSYTNSDGQQVDLIYDYDDNPIYYIIPKFGTDKLIPTNGP